MRKWLRSLFTDALKSGLLAALALIMPPAAVIWAKGLDFLSTSHPVAGWLIVLSTGAVGLFVSSIVCNVVQWRRAASPRNLRLVAEAAPTALWWHMGAQGTKQVMQVVGDFHITNVSPYNVTVPRSVLILSYTAWRVIPWRRRVEGFGLLDTVLEAHHLVRERLHWWVEPPVLKSGQQLRAKAGVVDNFGRTNWGEWLDFKYAS